MANRSNARKAALILTVLLMTTPPPLFSGLGPPAKETGESSAGAGENLATGLITDRLSPKQLKTWRTIEQTALSNDGAGEPLYPTLQELFTWAKMSGVPIYIEMPKPKRRWDYEAGKCLFEVEQGGPRSRLTSVTILLYTTVIDRAPGQRRRNDRGFVPFEGLRGAEPYCETLAHELAHVRQVVTDIEFLELWERQKSLADEIPRLLALRLVAANRQLITRQMRAIGGELDVLSERVEAPAIAVEVRVWHELRVRRLPESSCGHSRRPLWILPAASSHGVH